MRWLGSKVRELIQFRKEREMEPPRQEVSKPKRPFRLWSASVPEGEDVERLKALVSSARKLEAAVRSDGWSEILDCKMFYQANADAKAKSPLVSDKDRFQAACEFSTLEGFFSEISRRIRKGKEAEAELEMRVAKR